MKELKELNELKDRKDRRAGETSERAKRFEVLPLKANFRAVHGQKEVSRTGKAAIAFSTITAILNLCLAEGTRNIAVPYRRAPRTAFAVPTLLST